MDAKEELQFLPVSVNITEKKILIVGGGNVALHKATILKRFADNVTVISPEFLNGFGALDFTLIRKRFEPSDLDGFFLVYVCTGDESLNAHIREECAKRGILASVCDNPALCDFISPAIFTQEHITISVSTNAREVKRAIRIRDRICELSQNRTLSLE